MAMKAKLIEPILAHLETWICMVKESLEESVKLEREKSLKSSGLQGNLKNRKQG